jgi:RNA polymerase sigma-70 factor (ECF subfamily)
MFAMLDLHSTIDSLYRTESRRVLATLIRLLGDFDTAEEALHDAFAEAMEKWTVDALPKNPTAWLVSTGRFKAIDKLRRQSRFSAAPVELDQHPHSDGPDIADQIDDVVADDQLRMIFTCCHPALSPEARVALTLREVCGLTTEEIARAFLTTPATLAQRIVRAKAKIRDARIPYEVPSESELPERLDAVLQVIYLVFNEGYSASVGDSLTRPDMSGEAIRLGRLLLQLLPEPEVEGLLALMLLQESRRSARTTAEGDLILLEDQDRSLWNVEFIEEGLALVREAFASGRIGAYALQAAIATVHARAHSTSETDWNEIVVLYDLLLRLNPSPIIELNRAVALAMRDGATTGLALIDGILARGELADYYLAHSARADLLRRLGRTADARVAYQRALELTQLEPERRFLTRRLEELQ